MTPPPTDTPECEAFRRAVAEMVDPDPTHPKTCADCRRYASSARAIIGLADLPRPTPTAGFSNRVVIAALRERRVRAYRRVGAGLAVAAGLIVAVVLSRPKPEPQYVQVQPPERVEDRLADAGSALAALTRRTADDVIGPARSLVPTLDAPTFSAAGFVPSEAEPAVEALAEIPQAAQAGFEPVTNSARRAVALFLRDTGLSDPTTH